MLIDALIDRADTIQLTEPRTPICVEIHHSNLYVKMETEKLYEITQDAFQTLLNIIRLPIKYVYRLIEERNDELAQDNINFWLRGKDISLLIDHDVVTQVFDTKKMYVPSLTINDAIIDHLGFEGVEVRDWDLEGDIYQALYIGPNKIEVNGKQYGLGVNVLFSDCFNITPRFDGALVDESNDIAWLYPVIGRKFRVAQNTVSQIIDQVREFTDIALDRATNELGKAVDSSSELEVHFPEFIERMCSDLRLNRKLVGIMVTEDNYGKLSFLEAVKNISGLLPQTGLNAESIRNIRVALSNYAVNNRLK